MKKNQINIKVRLATLVMLLLSSPAWSNVDIGVALFTFFGERTLELTHDDPLLLIVTLENQAAASVRQANRQNERMLAQFSNSDAYRKMSDEERIELQENHPVLAIPEVSIGSDSIAIVDLIRFVVRNANGDNVELTATPMASNEPNIGPVNLMLGESYLYRFAVTDSDLKELPSGEYYLAATLDTSGKDGMWQGTAFSNTIKLNLSMPHSDPAWEASDRRAMMLSTYLVESNEWVAAEEHARHWLEQHPDSVDGWAQLGESLAGQAKNTDAVAAFNVALTKFRAKYGNSPPEPPLDIINRIDAINNQDNSRKP